MKTSCYDSTQTPSLRYWRFGDGRQGFEVFEGVDGVFGGEGGFEIPGFGGVADRGLREVRRKALKTRNIRHANMHFLNLNLI